MLCGYILKCGEVNYAKWVFISGGNLIHLHSGKNSNNPIIQKITVINEFIFILSIFIIIIFIFCFIYSVITFPLSFIYLDYLYLYLVFIFNITIY